MSLPDVPGIDASALLKVLRSRLDPQTSSQVLSDLLTDTSWLTSSTTRLLIEIEAAGEVSDLDAARLLDALRSASVLDEVQLIDAGQLISLSASSPHSDDEVKALVWRVAEDEGVTLNAVRISTS